MAHEMKTATDFKTLFEMGTEVVDAKGRRIKIRKPGRLAQLRLAESLGDANNRYVSMISCILYVIEIDGLPFGPGSNKREAEAAYERLGEDGEAAITKFFNDHFGVSEESAKEKSTELAAEEKEQLKK